MLGKYFPIKIGINADAVTTANQLLKEFKKQKIKSEVKNWTDNFKKDRSNYLFQRDNTLYKNLLINTCVMLIFINLKCSFHRKTLLFSRLTMI